MASLAIFGDELDVARFLFGHECSLSLREASIRGRNAACR
jgi:hypothetical protein